MTTYFLLEIRVELTPDPEAVLASAAAAVRNGISRSTGELRYLFRLAGENVLCGILKGNVGEAVKEVNASVGSFVRLTCIPLRKHEIFAQKILKVDEKLAAPLKEPLKLEGDAFWLELRVGYRGKTMEEFLEMLVRESQAAYTVRTQGVELDLFKSVAERRVWCLIKGDVDSVDAISFTLPIMVENGDQCQVTPRAVEAV